MAISIGGLGSGLDTQGLVSQLVAAEAAGQNKLKAAKGVVAVKSGAWTSLSTLVKGLADKAATMQAADKLRLTSATSSSTPNVTVSSSSAASPGSLTFRVGQLATRHQLASAGAAAASSTVGAGTVVVSSGTTALGATVSTPGTGTTGRYDVVVRVADDGTRTATVNGTDTAFGTDDQGRTTLAAGGTTLTFAGQPQAGSAVLGVVATSATTTLAELSEALTKNGGPGSAAVMSTGTGATPYRLVLSAGETGTAGALSVTTSSGVTGLGALSTLSAAQDARLFVGDASSAVTVERSSNTVSDLLPGVTLTLVKADPAVDVTVSARRDDDAVVRQVRGLQDSLNSVLSWIGTNSKYDVAAKRGGPMVGDAGVRALAGQLREAQQTQLPDGTYRTVSAVGLTANRTGTYDLDEGKLKAALEADPEAAAKVVSAMAASLAKVAAAANEENGVVRTGLASTESRSKDLQSRIDAWDVRLLAVRKRYERQFSALDTAMARMSSQSTWLAGQINSLPTGGQ